MGDPTTVEAFDAELMRAFEQGDAARAASLYLAVLRRQPDGSWLWGTDMWISDAG